jgi:choline dehydrogenase-like flavoprotein
MSYDNGVLKQHWDVVVIGTGMGGATIGYALARKGKRVLFCEKGRSPLLDGLAIRGAYVEETFPRPEVAQGNYAQRLFLGGRCRDEWTDGASARNVRFVPFIGNGAGGSSALYGMAMERFFPRDFTPGSRGRNAPHDSSTSSWPITYEQLAPYYEAAERLYRVRGEGDATRGDDRMGYVGPPPPLTPAARELCELFQRKGLHPYRLPVACELVPDCTGCQGFLCARNCKNDSGRACLAPAMDCGAALLDEFEVLNLEADAHRVSGAIGVWRGRQVTLRADVFVLAAGALETPRILLRSASPVWCRGLANESGLVGKNLMRHLIDLWLVFTAARPGAADYTKEIAFNDLYDADESRLGSVQSFGRLPPARSMLWEMSEDARRGPFPPLAMMLNGVRPLLEPFIGAVFSRGIVLASIVEDFPYPENQVTVNDAAHRPRGFHYRIREPERRRIALMRDRMKGLLKPHRHLLIRQAENNRRLAHACGTCRFGHDPRTSVLDASNRAHGISNLYVVDGSFFPSSGGTNPGLTIAANALRVADIVVPGIIRR